MVATTSFFFYFLIFWLCVVVVVLILHPSSFAFPLHPGVQGEVKGEVKGELRGLARKCGKEGHQKTREIPEAFVIEKNGVMQKHPLPEKKGMAIPGNPLSFVLSCVCGFTDRWVF
eukprot:Hpha_TRINITY_DN16475_c2_g1::TRINITY_DN16475_c2_g1_i1::g.159572::m.159572